MDTLFGFLEAAPDAVVVVDGGGRIVVANRLADEMFGYTHEELVGQPVEALVPQRLRAAHAGHREAYVREPRTRPMGEGLELSGRRKDGTEFPVEISLAPLRTPEGTLVISIIRDTTQRRAAEARFRGLLESAPDGIVVVDRSATIVIVNSQTERLFGYAREELVGKHIEVLVPERFRDDHVHHRDGYLASPKTRPMGTASMSLTGRRRDGSEFPVEISLSPMRTDEGLLVSASVRDITERTHIEQELRRTIREREVLLREIHHRVKNNLQVVSSLLALQMDRIHDPEALTLFQESRSRVRSIALFHERLYQSDDLAHVDVAEYLEGVAKALFGTYGVATAEVGLAVRAEDVPLGVDAAIACGLVVNELVSNALKHAFPHRRGSVEVALRRTADDVVVEVADDGVGFPHGLDFRRAETLGLRLVSILTEQLGGTLELDRGAGTRFVVRFPYGGHA